MATVSALHAVTTGIAQSLGRAYQLHPITGIACTFGAVGTTDFRKLDGQTTSCSIFVYRVTQNEHLRNRPPVRRAVPLTVNLHMLFTIWADSPLREQSLLAWLLRELHERPVLDNSVLAPSGGFDPADQVLLAAEELSLDDVAKLWQILTPPYRASLTYVARNIPIDLEPMPVFPPAVATRFAMQDGVQP
jgi:hypothetical protein